MADNLQATPRNQLLGLLSDAMYGGLDWMKSPERTQQMQGLAGLLESTGIPQTTQRMAYGEPLTNIGSANVPLLKPETAEAMMNVAPLMPAVGRLAGRAVKATEGLPVGMSIKDVGGNIFEDATKYHQKVPEITSINVAKLKRMNAGEVADVSDEVAAKMDFSQPIKVSVFADGELRIVDGHHRVAAAKKLGIQSLPVELQAINAKGATLNKLAQEATYPQQAALDLAQQRAALPVEQGGLGLPANNTPEMRAQAMGFNVNAYRGTTGDIKSSVIPSDFFGSNYFGKGINLTTSPKDASKYASTDVGVNTDLVGKAELMSKRLGISYPEAKAQLTSGGGTVIPITANINNPLVIGSQKIQAPESVIRYALNESGYSGDIEKLVKQFKDANTGFEQFELIKSKQATPFYQNLSSLMNKNGLMIDESLSPKSEGGMHYVASSPEQIRSRFAAFDPFRKDVATATAMGVALPDLLAAEPTTEELQRRQSSSLLFP